MFRRPDGSLVHSPSDLVTFLRSRFASWMDRLRVDAPGAAEPEPGTAEDRLIAEMGNRHEKAWLDRQRAAGRDLVSIERRDGEPDLAGTRAALAGGREVIYQAALASDGFVGYADFLERVDGSSRLGGFHYEVLDTKLARSPKPDFIVQLCAYAEMLEAIQGRRPGRVSVILGTGEVQRFRTDDYFYAYLAIKRAFLEFMRAFDPSRRPEPDPKDDHGRWESVVERWVAETDHLSRVANITRSQIRKLAACGITTAAALVAAEVRRIPRLGDGVFDRLQAQARLQRQSPAEGAPAFELMTADPDEPRRGLALLPPPGRGDVWADFEGYPLVEGGLEYLFGAVTPDGGESRFHDWWAHDPAEEKRAFEQFVDFVWNRWRTDPGMHVYHYAPYEVGALRRLMGRHATREAEVDELLRHHVFVDLLTVVRQGVIIGAPSYSLKQVERLFRPPRSGGVATGGESIVAYHAFRESGEPRDWERSPMLRRIRDYNEEDCESTRLLTGWLRERQREARIAWVAQVAGGDDEEGGDDARSRVPGKDRENADLAAELLGAIPQDAALRQRDADRWRVQELLGWILEYHRREERTAWSERFKLSDLTHEELAEEITCLGNIEREPGDPVPLQRSKGWWYRFDADQDTKLDAGDGAFFSHDLSVKVTLETLDRDGGRVLLKIGPKFVARLAGGVPPEVSSLIPDDLVPADVLKAAIRAVARDWGATQRLPRHLEDLLLLRPPRLPGHSGGPLLRPGEDPVEGAVRIAPLLERTTLCIQGPPGTGKTYTAARMILDLLNRGKRVGVTSNGHLAIEHLLKKCCELDGGDLAFVKVGGDDRGAAMRAASRRGRWEGSPAKAAACEERIIGGTAWFFARDDVKDRFDYLFVDEAGQFPLANLVAVSRCCENLVLVGDQLQLAQPLRGSHPGESGRSSLEYALEGQTTVRGDFGIFLKDTRRLHPGICGFISGAIYDNRLVARPENARRVVRVPPRGAGLIPVEAGLVFLAVEHQGNTQASDEEAVTIQQVLRDLIGRERTDVQGRVAGRIGPEDILIVAPYNMQVRRLRRCLDPAPQIGSVDKFQGQEKPIVIVSMCASDGESSPRGIDFLLDRNRLNVAISRAESLAIVVGSPELARSRCATIRQMALVNTFSRVVEEGRGQRPGAPPAPAVDGGIPAEN